MSIYESVDDCLLVVTNLEDNIGKTNIPSTDNSALTSTVSKSTHFNYCVNIHSLIFINNDNNLT